MEAIKDNYIQQFAAALEETLAEMAELDCRAGMPVEQQGTLVSGGMAVILGITGARSGRAILDTGRETARKLAEQINGESYDINDEFIIYTMAELANIVSGRAITRVNNLHRTGLRLTPPGVFFGDRLNITSPRIKAELIEFSTPVGSLQLSIGFEGGR